jgi:probable HAF family extracellular repeat protein
LATFGTRAFGINDMGQIVGTYNDDSGIHGFLLSGGTYFNFDDPSATDGTRAHLFC